MPKTPEEMEATMVANLPASTGKPLDAWLALLTPKGLAKHGEIVKLLKTEHGVGHGYANLIAQRFLAAGKPAAAPGGDDLVEAQYAGPKAALRPTYDALIAAIRTLGADVDVSPKKTYVSLRRSKQFGLVQPSTATRLDVGLVLKGVEPKGRLEASGSFNAMVTHRVRVESKAEVDAELLGWLKRAYEAG